VSCDQSRISVYTSPVDCQGELAVGRTSTDYCGKEFELFTPSRQYYVRNNDSIVLLSPYNDTASITCDDRIEIQKVEIQTGYNRIKLRKGCKLNTKDMVIFSSVMMSSNSIVKNENTFIDISEELESLHKDLSVMHGINVSMLSQDLAKYTNSAKIEALDINEAVKELDKFKHIDDLKHFDPFKFDLEHPTKVTNVVKGMAWLIMFGILTGACLCCYKVCAPCACVVDGLWKMLKYSAVGMYRLCIRIFECIRKCRKNRNKGLSNQLTVSMSLNNTSKTDNTDLSVNIFEPKSASSPVHQPLLEFSNPQITRPIPHIEVTPPINETPIVRPRPNFRPVRLARVIEKSNTTDSSEGSWIGLGPGDLTQDSLDPRFNFKKDWFEDCSTTDFVSDNELQRHGYARKVTGPAIIVDNKSGWFIHLNQGRLTLRRQKDDNVIVYYNYITDRIEDDVGNKLTGESFPPAPLKGVLLKGVAKLCPPVVYDETEDEKRRVIWHKDIYFDPVSNSFKYVETDEIASGFKMNI